MSTTSKEGVAPPERPIPPYYNDGIVCRFCLGPHMEGACPWLMEGAAKEVGVASATIASGDEVDHVALAA